jgi:hypothetical protein
LSSSSSVVLHLRVVAVLDVLEQLAIVAEEAFDAALLHQAAQHAHGQVGFAHADGAGEEQALAGGIHGVSLDKLAGGQVGAAQRGVGAAEGGLIAVQGVMAVALGNVRGGQAALFAHHLLALAGARNPLARALTTRTRPTPSQIGRHSSGFKPSATGRERAGAGPVTGCGKALASLRRNSYNRKRVSALVS